MKSVRHGYQPAICLLGESVSPFDLRKYRVAITSYSYLTAEVNRAARFQYAIKDYNVVLATLVPERPSCFSVLAA